jgi:hypothetical protein
MGLPELNMADTINPRNSRKLGLLTVPGALFSFHLGLTCSLCVSSYVALLSSLGAGFLASSTYLLPLTIVMFALALFALGLQAKSRGYGPLLLGLVSVAIILPSKFLLDSNEMVYAGAAILTIASVWSLVRARSAAPACPAGVGSGEIRTPS